MAHGLQKSKYWPLQNVLGEIFLHTTMINGNVTHTSLNSVKMLFTYLMRNITSNLFWDHNKSTEINPIQIVILFIHQLQKGKKQVKFQNVWFQEGICSQGCSQKINDYYISYNHVCKGLN